jgi:acetylornithine deacetylase/succinyl-diaminopimelate desuccinylase-like protein
VLLAVAKAMGAASVQTQGTIYFVANVGEEGPGNLRGVKHLFAKPPAKIDYFISIDGTGLGLTSKAVGSNRYKVSYKGPGGHSYGAFGMPSPIHALGRAIAKISAIQVRRRPRSTSASSRAGLRSTRSRLSARWRWTFVQNRRRSWPR